MSWSEVKKINSNLSVPLNEAKIGGMNTAIVDVYTTSLPSITNNTSTINITQEGELIYNTYNNVFGTYNFYTGSSKTITAYGGSDAVIGSADGIVYFLTSYDMYGNNNFYKYDGSSFVAFNANYISAVRGKSKLIYHNGELHLLYAGQGGYNVSSITSYDKHFKLVNDNFVMLDDVMPIGTLSGYSIVSKGGFLHLYGDGKHYRWNNGNSWELINENLPETKFAVVYRDNVTLFDSFADNIYIIDDNDNIVNQIKMRKTLKQFFSNNIYGVDSICSNNDYIVLKFSASSSISMLCFIKILSKEAEATYIKNKRCVLQTVLPKNKIISLPDGAKITSTFTDNLQILNERECKVINDGSVVLEYDLELSKINNRIDNVDKLYCIY